MKHFTTSILLFAVIVGWCILASADETTGSSTTTRAQPADLGLKAAVVTLNYDKAPLTKVLDDLSRQMGTELGQKEPRDLQGEAEPTITIHLDHGSYWQALAAIRDQGSSGLRFYPAPPSLPLVDQPRLIGNLAKSHWQTNGPFFITVGGIRVSHFVHYGTVETKGTDLMISQMAILGEPQIQLLDVTSKNLLRECVDEKGNKLSVIIDGASPRPLDYHDEGEMRATYGYVMQIEIAVPPNLGHRIAMLRGELDVVVQTKSQLVEFDAAPGAAKQTKTFGDNSVTLAKVMAREDGDTGVSLALEGNIARQSLTTIRQMLSQMQFFDPQGRICQAHIVKIDGGSDKPYQLSLRTYPAPKTMRWNAPLEIGPMAIPFELHDLPLAN
jgi:hypothetical protein